MAKSLTIYDGAVYKQDDKGKWNRLSEGEGRRELIMQQQVQAMSGFDRAMVGAGGYFRNTLSGARELMGIGDPMQEQQLRAETQQQMQPFQEYGGMPVQAGEFLAPGVTAVIPGGLKTQMAIGGLQGAAERPETPFQGFGLGAGLTWAGDWAAQGVGRIMRTLTAKRQALDPGLRSKLEAGEAAGLEFTPGQKEGPLSATRMMERQLMKNPRYAQLDLDRYLSNQAALNNAAAEALGETPTGLVTGEMRGQVVDKVGDAFDAVAKYSEPVELLGRDWLDEVSNLTDSGHQLHERFIRKFPGLFEGQPINGKQFVDARNWLAKQTRATSNIQSGAAEELQPFLRIMDDSLEAANFEKQPALVNRIRDARQKWKAELVIEDSQRGAQAAAGGNVPALSAYSSLRKYDKGGVFRGRSRDKFSTIVDSMAAVGDTAPPVMPSTDVGGGPLRALTDALWSGPAAERYMRGENIGRAMLGQFDELQPGTTELLQRGGIGVTRGIMADDEEPLP